MGTFKRASLDEIYNHILDNAHLDEVVVAKGPALMKDLAFVELDRATYQNIVPDIEDMNDISREKARFMLDVCMLNLLHKSKRRDSSTLLGIDVHLSTLMKTTYRSRYLIVFADYLTRCKHKVLLNIKNVPEYINVTRLSDMLRYLIPIETQVSMQVSQENILGQDLNRIAVKYFVLSVHDLTEINNSMRRDMTMERLAKLPALDKHIIVRNGVEVVVEQPSNAVYL